MHETEKQFIATDKDKALEQLIIERIADLQDFNETYEHEVSAETYAKVDALINKLEDDNLFFNKKTNDMKLIIYNNSFPTELNKLK